MNLHQLFIETDDISDSLIGTRLQVRAREIKIGGAYLWVAYTVTIGGNGGLRAIRRLTDKHGMRVNSAAGKGELIEKINELAKAGRLP